MLPHVAALTTVEMCHGSFRWLISGFSTFCFHLQLMFVWGHLPCSLERVGDWKKPTKRNFYQCDLNLKQPYPRDWQRLCWLFSWGVFWEFIAVDSFYLGIFYSLHCTFSLWMSTDFLLSQLTWSSPSHEHFYISPSSLTSGYRKIVLMPKLYISLWCHFIPGLCKCDFTNFGLVICQLKKEYKNRFWIKE